MKKSYLISYENGCGGSSSMLYATRQQNMCGETSTQFIVSEKNQCGKITRKATNNEIFEAFDRLLKSRESLYREASTCDESQCGSCHEYAATHTCGSISSCSIKHGLVFKH